MAFLMVVPGLAEIGSAVGGLFAGMGATANYQPQTTQADIDRVKACFSGTAALAWSPPAGDLLASVDRRQMQMWQRALEAKGAELAAQLGRPDFNLPPESVLALERAKMIAENAPAVVMPDRLSARLLHGDLAPWFWTGVGLVIGLLQFLGVF
jgi:hypothetical protein